MRMIFSGDEMSTHTLCAEAKRSAPEGKTGVPGLPAARFQDPGRTNAPSFRISSLLLVLILGGPLSAQERPESPVFKDYKPPDKVSLIEPSTATYDLWQVFSLTRKANAGDPVAQHDLGVRYLLGRGVAADTVRGAYWIQKAAAQNVIPARFNLGILFYHGWGVEWNPFEAYIHFTYCASMNMDEAKYVLGQFLSDGLVVPRDYSRARRIVSGAVAAGYEPAKRMLEQMETTRRRRVGTSRCFAMS
jgi:TPR repeat protein